MRHKARDGCGLEAGAWVVNLCEAACRYDVAECLYSCRRATSNSMLQAPAKLRNKGLSVVWCTTAVVRQLSLSPARLSSPGRVCIWWAHVSEPFLSADYVPRVLQH